MKISNIKIFDYQQFKNFELDLTYPKGHEKAGQPLDKVCLIGQSGTGKTTILKIIREKLSKQSWNPSHEDLKSRSIYEIVTMANSIKYFWLKNEDNYWSFKDDNTFTEELYKEYWKHKELNLIYFPAEYIDKVHQILIKKNINSPISFSTSLAEIENDIKVNEEKIAYEAKRKKYYDFENDNVLEIWKEILKEISDYRLQRLNFAQELVEIKRPKDLLQKVEQWQKDNENPLKDLAKVLNPILNKFQLEIDIEPKFKSLEELNYIQIKSINGDPVPRNGWSTGTKQITDTAIPLYKLNTKETIVLFDEPERSLYPDLQRMIIPYYTKTLAPDAQFFFATHSPVIASSFEPWEIVELEFDENGYVQRKLYYEGENHIDNYTIDPRYLRWDSILELMFDVEEDGNSDFRVPKLMELATLEKQLQQMANGNGEKKILWNKYKKLAQLLDWQIDN